MGNPGLELSMSSIEGFQESFESIQSVNNFVCVFIEFFLRFIYRAFISFSLSLSLISLSLSSSVCVCVCRALELTRVLNVMIRSLIGFEFCLPERNFCLVL